MLKRDCKLCREAKGASCTAQNNCASLTTQCLSIQRDVCQSVLKSFQQGLLADMSCDIRVTAATDNYWDKICLPNHKVCSPLAYGLSQKQDPTRHGHCASSMQIQTINLNVNLFSFLSHRRLSNCRPYAIKVKFERRCGSVQKLVPGGKYKKLSVADKPLC